MARQFREECRKKETEKEAIQKELDLAKVQIEELKASVSSLTTTKGPVVTTGWPSSTDVTASSEGGKKVEQILRDKLQEVYCYRF